MKKILCAILCITLAMFALVGCAEDVIGEFLEEYDYVPQEVEPLTLNFYIIGGEGSSKNAQDTVNQRIATYTQDKYFTTVNVIYVSESNYKETIAEKTAEGAENRADIILINSKEMFDTLYQGGLLTDLTEFYNSDDFGKLNVQLSADLLAASYVNVTETVDGQEVTTPKIFTVPNNRVVGNYTYITIDKAIAREYYISDSVLATYTSMQQIQKTNLWRTLLLDNKNPEQYIAETVIPDSVIPYLDKSYYCNTVETPVDEENGEYKYLVIDKEMAAQHGITEDVIASYNNYKAAKDGELWSKIEAAGEDPKAYIKEIVANKLAKQIIEDGTAYHCNVIEENEDDKTSKVILINSEIAKQYNVDEAELSTYTDIDNIKSKNLWHRLLDNGINPADYIKEVVGMYEDKALLEAQNKYCNISAYPTVTAEEAFSSAFAIVNGTKDAKRAMEIIYAVNNDSELRNMIQYGVKDTNYRIEEVNVGTEAEPVKVYYVVRNVGDKVSYVMDLEYTGNVFNAFYCDELGWTKEASDNGRKQNDDSNSN